MLLTHAELGGGHLRRAGLIRQNLGVSEWVYARELDVLLDAPAAVAAYPVLVNRLRRLREARRAARGNVRVCT